jgi:L-alanine-DL-glutamate epimerase-like enolase superfamily enzyme
MKISAIETFSLAGIMEASSYGFVVKVTASDGTVGYGEADTLPTAAEAITRASSHHETMGGLAEVLIGADPTEIETLWQRMTTATMSFGRGGAAHQVMAAIDIALWDLTGKLAGKPVSELIGGRLRDRVQVYASHGLGDSPAASAAIARRFVAEGFRAVKFGWPPLGPDPNLDAEIVGSLRGAVGPDVALLIDGGMAWSVDQVLDRAKRFAQFDLHWLEEPLLPYDPAAYATVRRAASIPIAAGEMATGAAELQRLIEVGSVDFLQIDIARIGITEGIRLARLAAQHGIAVVNHTYSHILNTAASLHLMAVAENVGLFEHPAGKNEIRDALAGGQLRPETGWIAVPSGPGLGVSVDDNVLRRFRQGRAAPASDGTRPAAR